MLLSAIKKLSKKKAQAKNPDSAPSKNVYGAGGIGVPLPQGSGSTPPESGSGESGGGDGGD